MLFADSMVRGVFLGAIPLVWLAGLLTPPLYVVLLGTALGGPLTTALGPRATLGGSGLATVALGAVACVLLLARRMHR